MEKVQHYLFIIVLFLITQNSAVGPCGEIYNNGSNTTIISNSYFGPNTATSILSNGTTSDTGSVIGNRSNKSLVVFNCNFENISFEGDSVIAVYKDPATHISDIKPIEDFILFNNTVDLSKFNKTRVMASNCKTIWRRLY